MHSLPFTGATKRRRSLVALVVVAIDLAGCVLGRIPRASHRQSRTSPFHEIGGELIGHLRSGRKRVLGCDKNRCRSAGTFASWTWVIRTVTHIAVTTPAVNCNEAGFWAMERRVQTDESGAVFLNSKRIPHRIDQLRGRGGDEAKWMVASSRATAECRFLTRNTGGAEFLRKQGIKAPGD